MPTINIGKRGYAITFDIEKEVIKPMKLGYYREAFAKLDSIIEIVLEHKIKKVFKSNDAHSLIECMKKAKCYPSQIAYYAGIINRGQKSRLDRFKSLRNSILHNSYGELSVLLKRNVKSIEDIKDILEEEINKGISLINEIIKD